MHPDILHAIKNDFLAFCQHALRELDGTKLSDDPYLELLATRLRELSDGSIKRLLINLPPRHAKTKVCTISFAAWLLANDPTLKILVITYGKSLAREISHAVRQILRSRSIREAFGVKIAKDFDQVDNFRTKVGGQLYATSFDGSITGFGGDVIIVDDPHQQQDAAFPDRLQKTIDTFWSVVVNRLNSPKRGRILVVGHRVHEQDLSADLIESGDYTEVSLPATAPRRRTYKTDYGPWRRRKGQPLRADTTRAYFERLRKKQVNPPYELLYMQGVEESVLRSIKAEHFQRFEKGAVANLPHFLSIDTAAKDADDSSFNVLQAWATDGTNFFLVDEFRERCDFARLVSVARKYVWKFHGVPVLVEETANGCALLCTLKAKKLHAIVPRGSKVARFQPHVEKIVNGRIWLPTNAPFAADLINEFVTFPHGEHTDQVDAFSQFVGWFEEQRDIDFTRKNYSERALAAIAHRYDLPTNESSYSRSDDPSKGLISIARPIRPRPF